MSDTHALPLHVQISEMLIRDIHAGRLLDGARLPPERSFAETLGISVGTLRRALADLAEKGMLDRVQGSGNYVRAAPGAQSVYSFVRVELLAGGGLPTAELLSVERLSKPADLPAFGSSDHAHRIRRLRRLSGTPAVLEEIWLDAGYARTITAADLKESLYLFYREALGLWISRAEDRLGTAPVPDWAPPAFGPKPGAPALMATRVAFAQDGARAEVSRNWIDTEVAAYVARLA
ncbi:GntR family transcriptional regulator [Citreimonas sp.]|uniref:GntR family transcriptional regulator n=1 Tax=Citreimonas sp. TaxID=3036715 RepID=UPI0035C8680A